MNEKISIIVPVYNAADYLRGCVDSLERQTYENKEIILVDDGSSDGSEKICDELKEKYGNVAVIHQKNAGASAARNSGMKAADGKYIVFCDSDDTVLPGTLEKLYAAKQQYPDRLPVCGIKKLFGNTGKECTLDGDALVPVDKKDFYVIQKAQLFNAPVNKLYEMETIEKNSLIFNTSVALGEDLIFNADYVIASGCDFIVVNEPLYIYDTQVSGSVSKKYLPHMLDDYLALDGKLHELEKYTGADMEKYGGRYSTVTLFNIVNVLKNTTSEGNGDSPSEKKKYIKKILASFNVDYILRHADCSAYNSTFIKLLGTKSPGLIYSYFKLKQ